MDYHFPALIQENIERYAESEQITAEEAAIKIIQAGLKMVRPNKSQTRLTDAQWQELRQDPTVAFFERLPDHVLEQMEAASMEIHEETFSPRG